MAIDALSLLQSIGSQRDWNAPMNLSADIFPMAILSCAIDGEDMALRRVFKRKLRAREPGTYVDIGCSAPVEMSNTYMFYCYGWRGVCIDASDDYKAAYAGLRPNDTFVPAAITESQSDVFLFKHSANKGMHRIGLTPEVPEGFAHPALRVPSKRLDRILEEHLPNTPIDFFSIDVEGAEAQVLRSNDWHRWRPRAILMECHDFTFDAPHAAETVKYLSDLDYQLVARIGPNVIMTDRRAP